VPAPPRHAGLSHVAAIARGLGAHSAAFLASLVITFFLSPFVIHRLGAIGFGVWALVQSLIGYLTLCDLGLRGAVTRFVARYHAQEQHLRSSQVVSAAIWFWLLIGTLVVAASAIAGRFVLALFHIPPELVASAAWVLIVLSANFAMVLAANAFHATLAALRRFDLLGGITTARLILRAAATVWLLEAGYGLVALAVMELALTTLTGLTAAGLCVRLYPQLRIVLRPPRAEACRELWHYSAWVLVLHVSVQVVYYTDNVVVGAFASLGAVTVFSIAGSLVECLRQMVSSLTMTFVPVASNLEATDDRRRLQGLLIHGTRAALCLALPPAVALFFRGQTFIALWMGEQYGGPSGRVLQILLGSQVFALANSASGNIAYGLGRHRPVAIWAAGEALANVTLSVLLVRHLGVEGVAWGTTIPSLFTALVLWPWYACRLVDVPLRHYLWQGWLRPAAAALPFAAACALADRLWSPASLVAFFLQTAALLPALVLGVGVCFPREMAWLWRTGAARLSRTAYRAPAGGAARP
jgi:O-antigen/teichoic acid export membrane protein